MGPEAQMQGIPAQPGSALFPTEKVLNDLQERLVNQRIATTGKAAHQAPEGVQLFNQHVQSQIDAHVERTGRLPNKQEFNEFVTIARGMTEKEPVKGGTKERKELADIDNTRADIDSTKEKTKTEIVMRPEQFKETQAKTAELLSKMNLNITEASRAITRGQNAEYLAKIEGARAGMSELKSQIQTVSAVLAGHDLNKEDRIKLDQHLLDMVKSGLDISKRGGPFGLDFLDSGKPNVSLSQIRPAGSSMPDASNLGPNDLTMLSPANTGVDPTSFAPKAPGMVAPTPQLAPPAEVPTTDEQQEYLKLRRAGKTKEQAERILEKKKAK
jgi:hypothetical protein